MHFSWILLKAGVEGLLPLEELSSQQAERLQAVKEEARVYHRERDSARKSAKHPDFECL